MWVDLIQSIERLKRKDWDPQRGKNSAFKLPLDSRLQHWLLPESLGRLPDFGLASTLHPALMPVCTVWVGTRAHVHVSCWFCFLHRTDTNSYLELSDNGNIRFFRFEEDSPTYICSMYCFKLSSLYFTHVSTTTISINWDFSERFLHPAYSLRFPVWDLCTFGKKALISPS